MTSNQAENKVVLMGRGNTIIPLTVSNPVINPVIPYVGKIPGGINHDKAVVFQGTVPATAKRFVINFKTGPSASDDITFHYSPSIGEVASLNSCKSGNWGTEYKLQGTPFTKEGAFLILVVINSVGYEFSVNGVVQCFFNHRFPLDKVPTLDIHGDISLNLLGFIDNWSTTSTFWELQTAQSTQSSTPSFAFLPSEISHPFIYPAISHVFSTPVGLHQDKAMFFQGLLPLDSTGFTIQFRTGTAIGNDVAFHYNPHIGLYTTLKCFKNLTWETVEAVSDKPFTKGRAFLLIVGINSEGYQVYVNRLRHCTLKHYVPVEKVSTISIQGNLSKLICGFINSWSTSSFFKELQKFSVPESLSTISQFRPFHISNPFILQALPLVSSLIPRIQQNMAFFFQGSVSPVGKGFVINLKVGLSEGTEIAFHYNVRIGDRTTLNCFIDEYWEKEEFVPVKPYIRGGVFQMIIVIKSEGYEVYVNGSRHFVFKHRIPLPRVTAIEIRGDIPELLCGKIYNWHTSSVFMELQKIAIARSIFAISESITFQMFQYLVRNPAIPYVGNIPGGLKKDMAVVFHGSVPSVDKGFNVNFKEGPSGNADIAFHFNPRTGSSTVMNSLRNGNWETEEIKVHNPFTKGADFQMIVVISSYGYEIYVNGKSQFTFKHRLPLENVSTIYLEGELTIQLIGFVDNWKTY